MRGGFLVSGFPRWFDILGQYNLAPAVLSTIYFTIFPRDMWEDIFWWRQKNILYKKIFCITNTWPTPVLFCNLMFPILQVLFIFPNIGFRNFFHYKLEM